MNKKIFKFAAVVLAGAFPLFTFAQVTLKSLSCTVVGYIGLAVYLIMALAVLVFVWNVYRYFIVSDANRQDAGLYVLYSVLGFVVILSLWGLVNIVTNSFNLQNSTGTSFSLLPSTNFCGTSSTGNTFTGQSSNLGGTNTFTGQSSNLGGNNSINPETGQPYYDQYGNPISP